MVRSCRDLQELNMSVDANNDQNKDIGVWDRCRVTPGLHFDRMLATTGEE